ncbi:ATP-binding protein [Chryseolinea sp. T2]|uniref:sensor histidine kinase n=1 Tax=Chryseolinea sp. T2 TaxID=3129255 RepID=UPI003076CE27
MTSNRFEKYAIHALMISIAGLLLLNIFLIYRNSRVIELNKQLQEEAEKIKVNTLDIIRTIHQIDMGLRAYALIESPVQYKVVTDGYPRLDTIFVNLRRSLSRQDFPMHSLQSLEDSTYQYLDTVNAMIDMLHAKNLEGFKNVLRKDLGYFTYKHYLRFSAEVTSFEDNIATNAKARYNRALENSYWLQIALFLITVPALMMMMRLFDRNVKISRMLGEAERAAINSLASQKEDLERQVAARTNDIVEQNREIIAQNEEIRQHNEQIMLHQKEIDRQRIDVLDKNERLQEAYETIERQNLIIQQKNRELMAEVDHQTQYLRMKNQELAEQNARLEQFAYIISHNLRAPMARLVGLASVLRKSGDEEEKSDIIDLMVRSTADFDEVFRDLSMILSIQKLSPAVYTTIPLDQVTQKVMNQLSSEIRDTSVEVKTDFSEVPLLHSLPQYVESIFFNLISNSIKYRSPDRSPIINVRSRRDNGSTQIIFSDNGLGIDLNRHRDTVFNLYKRFHFHVEGKGLGLYLVRTQVEALGGTIRIESDPKIGSIFTISLQHYD